MEERTMLAIRYASRHLCEKLETGMAKVGSNPEWYHPKIADGLPLSAKVHKALDSHNVDRKDHYTKLTEIFQRPIESTKDLKVGEAVAVWNLRRGSHVPRK